MVSNSKVGKAKYYKSESKYNGSNDDWFSGGQYCSFHGINARQSFFLFVPEF